MSKLAVLGIDLCKTSFSVAGRSADGQVVLRRRVACDGTPVLLGKLPRCAVAMEACCGAHHVGRAAAALGHQVRLMPPEYVRPCVKAWKNDGRDAKAISEAATRPTMRFVPLKAEAQLDVQALHRARERLVAKRMALISQMDALLLERRIGLQQRRRADLRGRQSIGQQPHRQRGRQSPARLGWHRHPARLGRRRSDLRRRRH